MFDNRGLFPQRNNDQYLSNVCLKVNVCLHRRVGDYNSMYVSMKRTVFKCLTNAFVKTSAKLGSLNPKLTIE